MLLRENLGFKWTTNAVDITSLKKTNTNPLSLGIYTAGSSVGIGPYYRLLSSILP
jgi:hypothetical protein